MRAFTVAVGIVAAVAGSMIWAISLAIYQQIMEPNGFWIDSDGSQHPNFAENNTYWPRESRELGILLALAGVILIGNATWRSFAATAVLGVAWLGTTFVNAHLEEINVFAGNLLASKPWMLAIIIFFAAMLLYSQAATTKALMPVALALGVSPVAAIAAFPAVSALFVLPTYPSLLAAVEFDDTGSTRIGKYVFDHPFLIPGTMTIIFAVVLGYAFAATLL